MKDRMGQLGQRLLTATEKVGTNNLVFCSSYNVPTIFRNLQEVLSVEGAWYSPNTIPNMIQCQAFRFITQQPPIERIPPICHQGICRTPLCV